MNENENMTFWEKYQQICKDHDVKPHAVLKELGISTGAAANWKKGVCPNGEILRKISDYFDVSFEYLLSEDEISIIPKQKKLKMFFNTLLAIPQRWASLRSGKDVDEDIIISITRYTNCSMRFLYNEEIIEYTPKGEYDKGVAADTDTLHAIFEILDNCADSDEYKALQIQLSRIVLYNAAKKGFTKDTVLSYTEFEPKKMKFIYTGEKNKDNTLNYGMNFSDLTMMKKKTGLSYQYMFTGIE